VSDLFSKGVELIENAGSACFKRKVDQREGLLDPYSNLRTVLMEGSVKQSGQKATTLPPSHPKP